MTKKGAHTNGMMELGVRHATNRVLGLVRLPQARVRIDRTLCRSRAEGQYVLAVDTPLLVAAQKTRSRHTARAHTPTTDSVAGIRPAGLPREGRPSRHRARGDLDRAPSTIFCNKCVGPHATFLTRSC